MEKSNHFFLFFINFLFFSTISFSQNTIENYFDEVIQKENLPMSNGKLYTNTFKTTDTHQFYADTYSKEMISYENQNYDAVNLKYDIFRDILIFRPYGESEKFGIELIFENVNSFTLKNKKFVNLGTQINNNVNFIKGYYEESLKNDKISFYIKHKKDEISFVKNKQIHSSFEKNNEYMLLVNGEFHKVKNVKDVIKIFPALEKEIYQFEVDNDLILRANKDDFFEKLIKKISILIQ